MSEIIKRNEELEFQEAGGSNDAILGTLEGPCADFVDPTRNNRKYNEALWETVFNDPIVNEMLENGGIPGELDHPMDREEIDSSRIAILMKDKPTKKDGKLWAKFSILNTPLGKIAYTLAKAGFKLGISSRGSGEVIANYDGTETVDESTYDFKCFDLVLLPAVKDARLSLVTEGLTKTTNYNYKEALKESLASATEKDRKLMEDALNKLDIKLNEETQQLDEMAVYRPAFRIKEGKGDATVITSPSSPSDTGRPVRTVKNKQEGMDYLVSHPYEDLHLDYDHYTDSTLDLIEPVLIRISDIADLPMIVRCPVYIDGALDRGWYASKDASNIQAALLDNKVVLCQPRKFSKPPVFDKYGVLEEACQAKQKIEKEDCNSDKSTDIEEKCVSDAVDNNEALLDALQEALRAKSNLEKKVVNLQEKLSVCYAKETKSEEAANKYKATVKRLAEDVRHIKVLQTKIDAMGNQISELKEENGVLSRHLTVKDEQLSTLKEQLDTNASRAGIMRENLSEKDSRVETLSESLDKLGKKLNKAEAVSKKAITALRESEASTKKALNDNRLLREETQKIQAEHASLVESYAKLEKDMKLKESSYKGKLDRANTLVEKYKKATNIAVDRYIELQAVKLGSSVNEIKTRLPESYTFKDIDSVCESLRSYNLSMSKLPFTSNSGNKVRTSEGLKIKGTSSKNESIIPAGTNFDDDIDTDLLYLAGK